MSVPDAFNTSIGILVFAAIITAFVSGKRRLSGIISFIAIFISSAIIFYIIHRVYAIGPISWETTFEIPSLGVVLSYRIDAVSALFFIIISLVSLAASFYSIDYISHYKENLNRYYPFLLLFIACMLSTVCVSDMLFFFIFWEMMTLTSYLLVVFEKGNKVNLRAGFKYFVMTHVATFAMFVAAILIYRKTFLITGESSFSFDILKQTLAILITTSPALVHLILALFLVGFGTKAAFFPLGDWLPDAHPAAPSAVSAILSGVMIKMGVYGILRIFLEMLPPSHHAIIWGGIIAFFGGLSMFVGTVTALMQDDAKRILAFSSIGQMGYILLGIGMAVGFLPVCPAISVVAMIAGLYHMVNHAFFKGLLFLNAGSLVYKLGTRNLARMGGMIQILPFTAILTLIASFSIAGVPPFSGFSSKWLLFQISIMGGINLPLYLVVGLIGLFISAVTLAYCVKFFSCGFLRDVPEEYKNMTPDEPVTMKISGAFMAFFCIILGILPVFPIKIAYKLAEVLYPAGYPPQYMALLGNSPWVLNINIGEGFGGSLNPLLILLSILLCLGIAYFIFNLGGAPSRETEPWLCGEKHSSSELRYHPHSFYLPFKNVFVYRVGKYQLEGLYPRIPFPRLPDFTKILKAVDIDKWLYYPLVDIGRKALEKFSRTHVGIAHVYMLWMLIGLILAIIVLFSLK